MYDEIDGTISIGSARGAKADWYRNVVENPNVEVTKGSRHFKGRAVPITDQAQIVHFLEERLMRRTHFTGLIFRLAGLGSSPTHEQLQQYAKGRTVVAIRPIEEE